jgi:selenocysteine lyase/cysteine desulfurase
VFRLHAAVGGAYIRAREGVLLARARAVWGAHPCIRLAGVGGVGGGDGHLPIASFNVARRGRLLHWAFVAAALNDVFGVQCRGGCMCAGPYAQRLLGMTEAQAGTPRRLRMSFVAEMSGW